MKPITRDWAAKAEADFATASREVRARTRPNHDAVCYHAQQCIEKYLKARLIEANIAFPKTHDLVLLLDLTLPVEPFWETFRDDLALLTTFSVALRYPDHSADRTMALDAFRRLKMLRKAIAARVDTL